MRRLTLFLYLLLAFYANAAVNVRFTFSDFTTNPASVKQVVMTPLYQYGVSGTNVLITDKIATKTDKSGVCIVSNVTVGYAYRVELFSVTTTTYTNSFPTNLENGITVESIAYISASTNLGPSSLAYSQAAAESRFATIDMVSGGGINNVTATNISKNVAQSATNDYNSTILARRYIQQGTTNIQFQNESTNVPSQSEGLVYYDNATHTLAYYNDQSAVTVNIGQEEHVRVVNKTSGTISNGQPVTIFGFQGNRPKAILAYSTNIDLPYWSCIGLATHDIAVNAEGLVTAYGVVNGIDTRAYGSNTIYLSTNAGTLTTNLPPSGYNVVKVGIALNNTVNGSIWVSPVQPVHQDDVTGLTNRLAQIEGNTNFTSIHVTDNSTFESDVTANALKATDIYSGQRPLSVEIEIGRAHV